MSVCEMLVDVDAREGYDGRERAVGAWRMEVWRCSEGETKLAFWSRQFVTYDIAIWLQPPPAGSVTVGKDFIGHGTQ